MKKYIEFSDKVFEHLKSGMTVEGSLKMDPRTRKITFNGWNRKTPKHQKVQKVCDLDNGWLGRTELHYTEHLKYPRSIGYDRILDAMERNHRQAKAALTDEEIIDRV